MSRLIARGFSNIDPASLAVFRMALGLSVAWSAFETLTTSSLAVDYINPPIHLTYFGLDWVRPWPGNGTTLEFVVLLGSAVGFTLGLFYRASVFVLLVAFTHVFLMERSVYNNHNYLVILLALLANFMPLHREWSLDALRRETPPPSPRQWCLWLLRFQVGVVYFFGGVAKLDSDWLAGQPIRMWLAAKQSLPVVGPWMSEEWLVQCFVWGGLLIDLCAVPCLLWKWTRPAIFLILSAFHLINSQLFSIGFFPWLMLPATALFFPPDWPRRLLFLPPSIADASASDVQTWTLHRQCGVAFLAAYLALQCLIPLRHFLYPGNASWTEQGQLFAWRMMLRQKITAIRFYGVDPVSQRQGVLDIRPFLNPRQLATMSRNPELIAQFARKLAKFHADHGVPELEIRARALVSLNGRKPQLLIDPTVDVARASLQGRAWPWIMPLTEPLRHEAWNVPVSQWEQALEESSAGDSESSARNSPVTVTRSKN